MVRKAPTLDEFDEDVEEERSRFRPASDPWWQTATAPLAEFLRQPPPKSWPEIKLWATARGDLGRTDRLVIDIDACRGSLRAAIGRNARSIAYRNAVDLLDEKLTWLEVH